MSVIEAILLAVVEGLTEFLPVSSTGHMIITQSLLGIDSSEFVKSYTIIIQFGAIISVVILYWKRFFKLNDTSGMKSDSFIKRFIHKYDFYLKLFIAFIPAAFFGLIFNDIIDDMLGSVLIVAIMLVLGGILMLFVDKWFVNNDEKIEVNNKKAFRIGLFQCIAMIPGVSRSMSTIVGGMTQKLTRKKAAEFSFFLAVPTMFAAMCYKFYKLIKSGGLEILQENSSVLIVGNIVALVVAILAIRFFISFVSKYGFRFFGLYRIIVGGIILILIAMDIPLSMV